VVCEKIVVRLCPFFAGAFVLAVTQNQEIMKDFLLLIRTQGDVWTSLSPQQLQEHIENGTAYIGNLMKAGKLKGAAPLDKGSRVVTDANGIIKDGPFNETKEVIAGYFHITAKDMQEAVDIAKSNPIFKDIRTSIEVHPMKAIGG
jgi:hypothetical protein